MQIKLLCIGDVVGQPGRRVLREGLETLVSAEGIDCVIVNAENTAAGSGLTASLYKKVVASGANLLTLGDHIYRRRDIIPVLETEENIVRPANLPVGAPGKTFAAFETSGGVRVAVVSLLGRMFMKTPTDCPFAAVDRVLGKIPSDVNVVVVDVHAEATSEKVALGWHLDGKVSVVFGTHTHVPTADERILPGGTAYVTDVGMTGPYDSVLGRDKRRVIGAMVSGVPCSFDVAEHDLRMCGIMVTVESTTGRATAIERVCFNGNRTQPSS